MVSHGNAGRDWDGDRSRNVRIFHYTDGNSHKFWSATVEDCVTVVRFGRIGTSGQTVTKRFPSEADARKSCDDLVARKLKKGYAEVAPEAAAATPPRPRRARPSRQLLLPL
jgi:predicted DNA-binding WGR domain protein